MQSYTCHWVYFNSDTNLKLVCFKIIFFLIQDNTCRIVLVIKVANYYFSFFGSSFDSAHLPRVILVVIKLMTFKNLSCHPQTPRQIGNPLRVT